MLSGQKYDLAVQNTILEGKKPQDYDFALLMNSCDQGYGIFTMDDHSVFFFEKYLGELPKLFTATKLLVTLDILFKMMENGLYSVRKLKLILLHVLQIKANDELILDMINKTWSKAVTSWLPICHYEVVCKWLSNFFL